MKWRGPQRCPFCRAAIPFNQGLLPMIFFAYQPWCAPCGDNLRNRCSALEVNPW